MIIKKNDRLRGIDFPFNIIKIMEGGTAKVYGFIILIFPNRTHWVNCIYYRVGQRLPYEPRAMSMKYSALDDNRGIQVSEHVPYSKAMIKSTAAIIFLKWPIIVNFYKFIKRCFNIILQPGASCLI